MIPQPSLQPYCENEGMWVYDEGKSGTKTDYNKLSTGVHAVKSRSDLSIDRRTFLNRATCAVGYGVPLAGLSQAALCNAQRTDAAFATRHGMAGSLRDRVAGMLVGSLIGDAAGGPLEFKTHDELSEHETPIKQWSDDEVLDDEALRDRGAALTLLPYIELRPETHSYGPWTPEAPAGTLTDDSRMKIILMRAMRRAKSADQKTLSRKDLAREMIAFGNDEALLARPGYAELVKDWLHEWNLASRWVLGNRDLAQAIPPERLFSGIDTVAGQMALPPLAAKFAARPNQAYRAAYRLGFFDNGPAKDITSAVVAGLAAALATNDDPTDDSAQSSVPPAWHAMEQAMRRTDPFRYAEVRFVGRPTTRWLDFAADAVRRAEQKPARLFAILEKEVKARTWWEAHVNFAVCMAIARLCRYHPLASIQLALEFGHDTDSTAQLMGAMMGATYGASVFPPSLRQTVIERLRLDYDEDLAAWVNFLVDAAEQSIQKTTEHPTDEA